MFHVKHITLKMSICVRILSKTRRFVDKTRRGGRKIYPQFRPNPRCDFKKDDIYEQYRNMPAMRPRARFSHICRYVDNMWTKIWVYIAKKTRSLWIKKSGEREKSKIKNLKKNRGGCQRGRFAMAPPERGNLSGVGETLETIAPALSPIPAGRE